MSGPQRYEVNLLNQSRIMSLLPGLKKCQWVPLVYQVKGKLHGMEYKSYVTWPQIHSDLQSAPFFAHIFQMMTPISLPLKSEPEDLFNHQVWSLLASQSLIHPHCH